MKSEDKVLNIVLVYLGNKSPKYLEVNLEYLNAEFPGLKTWLITDDLSVSQRLITRGFNVWFYESSLNAWSEIYENMNFPKYFRNGFWFLTLKRFKALEAFMTEHKGSVLHVEADVFLLPKFPFQYFFEIEEDLAFPMVSKGYGIASTLFIKNVKAIENFNQFILNLSKSDPDLIDMTALSKYADKYPESVQILPSGPTTSPHKSGYYDGAAFGTFLFGQDPRNRRGLSLKYSKIDWHAEDIENMNFTLVNDELYVKYMNEQSRVYSLHLHSKEAKNFTKIGAMKGLRLAILEYEAGPKTVLRVSVLPRLLRDALMRRLLNRKTNV